MCSFRGQKRGFVLDFFNPKICIFLSDVHQLHQVSLRLEFLALFPVLHCIAAFLQRPPNAGRSSCHHHKPHSCWHWKKHPQQASCPTFLQPERLNIHKQHQEGITGDLLLDKLKLMTCFLHSGCNFSSQNKRTIHFTFYSIQMEDHS